ncbi:hypothetical protein BIW11_05154 [Tropilaelaps mercedesae]|uniref:Fucosyltransferase n=1 Tax=Tropilaelaps mercedesae TaxID=418985 RepID=A0A1V9Y3I9_9ACAR|nr:hypothetical protein BIW11_05154 [Tropilaelaps mercedesae]
MRLILTFFSATAPAVIKEDSTEVLNRIRGNQLRPILLLWTPVWNTYLKQEDLADMNCFGSSIPCDVTSDRGVAHEAAAIIFHARDVSFLDMPKKKYVGQPWILWNQESPSRSPRHVYEQGGTLFDLEMSYRRTADIFAPYGYITKNDPEIVGENKEELKRRFRMQKGAAWLASDCWTESRREDYVGELRKFFPVDVYGSCGNNVCSKHSADSCMGDISKKYMFYLAFENSLCPDYITEKLYRTLQYPIIPVVLSGARYSSLENHQSLFVDASNIEPRLLALKLQAISQNLTYYEKYFAWKKKYSARGQWSPICQVCNFARKQLKNSSVQTTKKPTYLTDRMNHKACKMWNSMHQQFEFVSL